MAKEHGTSNDILLYFHLSEIIISHLMLLIRTHLYQSLYLYGTHVKTQFGSS